MACVERLALEDAAGYANRGNVLLREGKEHSVYWNSANRRTPSVPRHAEVVDKLVREGEMGVGQPQDQHIIDEKGQKAPQVRPIEEYEELLEDLHDLAIIAERRDEPTMGSEELKRRLEESGRL